MMTEATKHESTNGAKTSTTAINGFEPAALVAAVEGIAANPQSGMIGFKVSTTWRGGVRSTTDVKEYWLGGQSIPHRHRIETDEPVEMFGRDEAPNPQDLLLAALNACMTVGFAVGATQRGIKLEALSIESRLDFDLRGAFGLDPSIPGGAGTIAYTVRVRCNASRAELEEVLTDTLARSPNVHHLTKPIVLKASLVLE